MPFTGLLLESADSRFTARVASLDEADLPPGEVLIRVSYSTLNYKDALAIQNRAPVVRSFPMVAGIDLVGVVESVAESSVVGQCFQPVLGSGGSKTNADASCPQADRQDACPTSKWRPGDAVLVNGWGLGETRWGGLAQLCRVPGDFLIRLPAGMTAATAMSIGTAGYTAMLCVNSLERGGLRPISRPSEPEPTPSPSKEGSRKSVVRENEVPLLGGARGGSPSEFKDADASVLVTGAAGGVGSMAISILARLGYRVIASTGRVTEADYLRSLGATEIIDRADLSALDKPLQKERWMAVVDSVGSHTLANACAGTKYRGWVAACGLAQGMDFPATVAPFILRGVSLFGIDSVRAPIAEREAAWKRLAELIDPTKLALMTRQICLDDAIAASGDLLAGKVRGRLLVAIG